MDNKAKLNIQMNSTSIEFAVARLGSGLEEKDEDYCWCKVSLTVKSHLFNYKKTDEEIITFYELKELYKSLDNLLNDRLQEPEFVDFTEPDLELYLFPQLYVRENDNVIYVKEGYEFVDIEAELIINLQDIDMIYRGEKYIYPLDRKEIVSLKDYLEKTIPILQKQWDEA